MAGTANGWTDDALICPVIQTDFDGGWQPVAWANEWSMSLPADEIRIEVASDTIERYKALIPEFETG